VHGAGIDEPLAMTRDNEIYYYHADGLGSIVALTDKKQRVVESYEYDSFGNLKDNAKSMQPFTYTGREWDKETELYYYRARYYDPMEGRFIQKDPIGFAGGINLYSYVGNNPLNYGSLAKYVQAQWFR
jgi:RHS repeat-associated protein